MYVLLMTAGRDAGFEYPIGHDELILIGRGEQCGIRLSDGSVSRVHCRVTPSGSRVCVQDAGSRWGTFVNGKRITDCDLQPGDELRVGESTLRLEITGGPRATTIAPRAAAPASRRLGAPGVLPRDATDEPFRQREESFVVEEHAQPDETIESCRRRHGQLVPVSFKSRTFLRFTIREHVATSASGLVFRAVDPRTNESVALKLFHPSSLAKESQRQRFLRAIRTMVGLRHENLVTLHAAGRHDGICYMVNEFVEGPSAAELIRTWGIAGMLDWRRTLSIGTDIARALGFAAEQGIVHRNITPRNILIRDNDDRALLNDLLLAKALDDPSAIDVTRPGEVVGDLPYLSPEQLGSGHPVDHRSDIYQLGATLYALLTGRPPFEGRTAVETIQQILTADPTPPTRYQLAIPAMLEGIILHMLSKRPEARSASPTELLQDLQSAERHLC